MTFTQQACQVHRRLSEWYFAIAMTLCGLTLLADGMFQLEAYEVIQLVIEQSSLATVMLGVGVARLIVLIVNGRKPRATAHLRYILAAISGFIWGLLCLGFFSFTTPLLIVSLLGPAAVFEAVIAYRAAQDARQVDESDARAR